MSWIAHTLNSILFFGKMIVLKWRAFMHRLYPTTSLVTKPSITIFKQTQNTNTWPQHQPIDPLIDWLLRKNAKSYKQSNNVANP